ncbi:MAG: hypothetical protein ACAI25_04320 [Planctomycetota bacterium]
MLRHRLAAFGLACALGLSTATPALSDPGRIDQRSVAPSGYEIDVEKINALYPGPVPIQKVEDAYTVIVDLGGGLKLPAPTHLFGASVNIVPYSNQHGGTDAAGKPVPRGDAEIARIFKPGEVGFAIKHHRPEKRYLAIATDQDKENLKLQDTHIGIVVGVWDTDEAGNSVKGAITVNNPQGYESGLFGTPTYSMIFARPTFPPHLSAREVCDFHANIRTMLVCFNTISKFPPGYNGSDPLAARSPKDVRLHVEMMLKAYAGDAEARAFFQKDENQIYCAELAYLATSAGVLFPLNDETCVPIVGEEVWARFKDALAAGAAFEGNPNPHVKKVKLSLARKGMKPLVEYDPEGATAFRPMTGGDIVQHFIRTHIPRENASLGGEALAPAQAQILAAMKPQLFEAMNLAADDPRRIPLEAAFGQILSVVGTSHDSYETFQKKLAPLLEAMRRALGDKLFIPPSLLHVVAQGKHPGGLVGLEVVGHGLHYSVVKKPEPTPNIGFTGAIDGGTAPVSTATPGNPGE